MKNADGIERMMPGENSFKYAIVYQEFTFSSNRLSVGSGIRSSHQRCHGDSTEYSICNQKNCPKADRIDFRLHQCSLYNERTVRGFYVASWTPNSPGSIIHGTDSKDWAEHVLAAAAKLLTQPTGADEADYQCWQSNGAPLRANLRPRPLGRGCSVALCGVEEKKNKKAGETQDPTDRFLWPIWFLRWSFACNRKLKSVRAQLPCTGNGFLVHLR